MKFVLCAIFIEWLFFKEWKPAVSEIKIPGFKFFLQIGAAK